MTSLFTPVSQEKFLIDLQERKLEVEELRDYVG